MPVPDAITQGFARDLSSLWIAFQFLLALGFTAGLAAIPVSLGLNELWKWAKHN